MLGWLARAFKSRPRTEDPLVPGTVLKAKYRVERAVGRGGMGVVLAAHHELLDQRVAVKILVDAAARDEELVTRFVREARAAAKLQSEHVVRVMDVDTLESGAPFLVMEYLDGRDLSQLMERAGPLRIVDVADYVLQALEGIAHAHAIGIVHRDLKPSNLFLARRVDGSKCIKILDFGIAKSSASAGKPVTTLTAAGAVGSPCYMSPEQIRTPKLVDARSDVWSMGVTLYELLTARTPFGGGGWAETVAAILEQAPPPMRPLRPDIPPRLEGVVLRCLERDRAKRFGDVGELAVALAEFGSGAEAETAQRVMQVLVGSARRSATSDAPPSAESTIVVNDATSMGASPHAQPDAMHATNSATASTVRWPKWTRGLRTTVRLRVAVAGGTTAGLAAAAALIVLAQRGSSVSARPPPEETASSTRSDTATAPLPAASAEPAVEREPEPPQTAGAALASASGVPSVVAPSKRAPARRPGSARGSGSAEAPVLPLPRELQGRP